MDNFHLTSREFPHGTNLQKTNQTLQSRNFQSIAQQQKQKLEKASKYHQTLAWFGLAEGEKTTGDDGYDIDNDDGKVR